MSLVGRPARNHPQQRADDDVDDRETTAERPLTFVYADPPYLGMGSRYEHPASKRWDDPNEHGQLMAHLNRSTDGWAVSASAPSLTELLPLAPEGTRVAAWVKPFAALKANVRVAYTWEPVLWRRIADRREGDPVGRDHLSANIRLQAGFFGAKPESFAEWVRVLLGAQTCDRIVDMFPGSGTCGDVFDANRLF